MRRENDLHRRSRFVLLGLALLAISAALAVLYLAFQVFIESPLEEATQHDLIGLALVAASLLVFAMFCVGILMLRYVSSGLLRQSPDGPTKYVDAWEIAGQRLEAPDEDELDGLLGDDDDQEDDDDDAQQP